MSIDGRIEESRVVNVQCSNRKVNNRKVYFSCVCVWCHIFASKFVLDLFLLFLQ